MKGVVAIARCNCGSGQLCTCTLQGDLTAECIEITVDGQGTSDGPFVIAAEPIFDAATSTCLNCDAGGFQLVFDPATEDCLNCGPSGIRLAISDTVGNQITCAADGLLVAAAAPVVADQDLAVFFRTGPLTVTTGVSRFKFPFAATIINVTAAVNTAPTGSDIILDVNKGGVTIFTTQANRPRILAGTFQETVDAVPDITAVANDEYLTVDVDQVGSSVAGSDLTVFVLYSRP